MKNSYDSNRLIQELDEDILEQGNFKLWAFSKEFEIEGQDKKERFFIDYDFISSEIGTREQEIKLEVGERKQEMFALDLMQALKKQNSLI